MAKGDWRNDKIFSVRLPRNLLDRMAAAAEREDLTVGQFIRRAAERELKGEAKQQTVARKLLTVEEVSDALCVSRATTNRMISDGQLVAICLRTGRRKKILRIEESEIQNFIEKLKAHKSPNLRVVSLTKSERK